MNGKIIALIGALFLIAPQPTDAKTIKKYMSGNRTWKIKNTSKLAEIVRIKFKTPPQGQAVYVQAILATNSSCKTNVMQTGRIICTGSGTHYSWSGENRTGPNYVDSTLTRTMFVPKKGGVTMTCVLKARVASTACHKKTATVLGSKTFLQVTSPMGDEIRKSWASELEAHKRHKNKRIYVGPGTPNGRNAKLMTYFHIYPDHPIVDTRAQLQLTECHEGSASCKAFDGPHKYSIVKARIVFKEYKLKKGKLCKTQYDPWEEVKITAAKHHQVLHLEHDFKRTPGCDNKVKAYVELRVISGNPVWFHSNSAVNKGGGSAFMWFGQNKASPTKKIAKKKTKTKKKKKKKAPSLVTRKAQNNPKPSTLNRYLTREER